MPILVWSTTMSMPKRDLVGVRDWWCRDGGEMFSGDWLTGLEEKWRIRMWTTSACDTANCAWSTSICCCRDDIAPTQPYTGSLILAFASYTIELTASPLWCSGNSYIKSYVQIIYKDKINYIYICSFENQEMTINTHS